MEQEKGSVATLPDNVRTEVVRMAHVLDRHVPEGYEAAVLKIFRDTVLPDLTWERWGEMVPGARLTSRAERRRQAEEREARRRARQNEITPLLERYQGGSQASWQRCEPLAALFSRHRYYIESSAVTNASYLAAWEANGEDISAVLTALGGTAGPPIMVAPPVTEPVERTCACDGCDTPECHGDCEQCDDHGCEQCYGHHSTYSCCGYCSECENHPDGPNGDEVCDLNHCHSCEHNCRD